MFNSTTLKYAVNDAVRIELIMKLINYLTATGCFCTVLSMFIPVIAQTPENVNYRITWHGKEHTDLSADCTITEQDGTTVSRSFNDELPSEITVTASPSATITASGASLGEDIHVLVRIYRDDKLCDEATSFGTGNYATVFCSPPLP